MTNYSELLEEIRAMREEGVPNLDGIEERVLGICCTCKFQETCTYLLNATKPVFHCEEFETLKPREIMTNVQPESEPEPQETTNLKGLCKTCATRTTCKFTKPESGIWHCEEYE